MATNTLSADVRPAKIARVTSSLSKVTERMIDRIDEIAGDPDLEHLREDDEDTYDREKEQAYE